MSFKKMLAMVDKIMEVHSGGKISVIRLLGHDLDERVKMECEDHGEFYETVSVLLEGRGCPECEVWTPPFGS